MTVTNRIYEAFRFASSQHLPADKFMVYLAPDMKGSLDRELDPGEDTPGFTVDHFMGLPVKTDPRLKPHEIVLRYEVRA